MSMEPSEWEEFTIEGEHPEQVPQPQPAPRQPSPRYPAPQPPADYGRPACLSFANRRKLRPEAVKSLAEDPQDVAEADGAFPEFDGTFLEGVDDDPAPVISTRWGDMGDEGAPLPSYDTRDYEPTHPAERFGWMKHPTPHVAQPDHGAPEYTGPEWAGPSGGEMPDKSSLLSRYYSLKADGAPVPDGMGPQSDSNLLLEAVTVGEAYVAEQHGLGMMQTGIIILFGLIEFANVKAGSPLAIADITHKMMARVHKFNTQLRRVWRLYFGASGNHPLVDLFMAVSMEIMQEHLMNTLLGAAFAPPSVGYAPAPPMPQPGVAAAAGAMNAAPPMTGPTPAPGPAPGANPLASMLSGMLGKGAPGGPPPDFSGLMSGLMTAMAAGANASAPTGPPKPGTRVYDQTAQSWAVDPGDGLRPYVDTDAPVPKAPPPSQ